MPRCASHWRQPVTVGAGSILCSALISRDDGIDAPQPDAAYYLDRNWREASRDATWPVTIIDWPDFGIIQTHELRPLADAIVAHLESGCTVEIACLGGHGRMGTLLATVIARAERISAAAALRETRARYCEHAVETLPQERLLYDVLGEPFTTDAFRR